MIAYIDAHVHPPVPAFLDGPLAPYRRGIEAHLGMVLEPLEPSEIAEHYRQRNARAVLHGWDTSEASGEIPFGSEKVAEVVAAAPDVFIGLGAVDPALGARSVARVHETASLGLAGLSFHPSAQGLAPTSRRAHPVFEAAEEHGLVCVVHTGATRVGAGMPGGGGIRLSPARPVYVDEVAASFPDLTLVIAHVGDLWFDEAVAVAEHKANVYLDLSGQDPTTFDGRLRHRLETDLVDKVVFGSDFPFGSPDRWLAKWDALGMPEKITNSVLRDTAQTVFGSAESAGE
ncbi:MAG: amidohydrolase [Acidimicrobiia bacterium]|nr:amidohydrolase [Acidimicrobiia bacterium]